MTKRIAEPAARSETLQDSEVAKKLKIGEKEATVAWTVSSDPQIIDVGSKLCSHEVAWPGVVEDSKAFQAPPKKSGPPAKQFPFTLDPFQQTAINCLEAGHSVLVSAHTSAGKTVVAEYAFAMALRDKQRVIYTSPLKALSNQKYREFYEEFADVGLMTGDVTINPEASCMVMTTEILRQMLYNESELVREAALVVYDEIHYLRDKERGVVWEESIITMPKSVRFAFLSATIPNAAEFAQWIAKSHRSPCHVVYTDFRPTPLQHYIFPIGGDGLHMVVDEKGTFREDGFQKAVAAVSDTAPASVKRQGKGRKDTQQIGQEQQSDIFRIVQMIMERQYDPVIVFSFSKRECEEMAQQMINIDLNSEREKKLVQGIFENAIDILAPEDKNLAQITGVLPMLKRGVGIHHSGLLPIVKEVIEILFQEGLLKALFATETFSTGLNMPAKTVVFTHARKFDGGGFRWVTSGEYIQMSGRAGRRGKDDRGIVILMLDGKMEPAVAKNMIKGAPDSLHSEFKLTYSMLLNLMRNESRVKTRELLAGSYRQFQTEQALPKLQQRIKDLQEEYDAVSIADEDQVQEYFELMQHASEVRRELWGLVQDHRRSVPYLQPGRIVQLLSHIDGVFAGDEDPGASLDDVLEGPDGRPEFRSEQTSWGAVVSFERIGSKSEADDAGPPGTTDRSKDGQWIVDVLANCAPKGLPGKGPRRHFRFVAAETDGDAQVVMVGLHQLVALSSVRVFIHKDLRPPENCQHGVKAISEVRRRMPDLPMLTEKDLQIDKGQYKKQRKKLDKFEEKLQEHPLAKSPELLSRLQTYQAKLRLHKSIKIAAKEARAASSIILLDELRHREKLLHRLGYLQDNLVTQKGRVAAEIQSADELLLTEMIFNSNLKSWSKEQIAALISCLVWQERQEKRTKLSEKLQGPFAELQQAARSIAKQALGCKMVVDVEEYVLSFRPELMEYAAEWSLGARFIDIQQKSDYFEGSLVRAFRRIEEVLKQLISGARVIGDLQLAEKFEETSVSIRRGVVFAASLYL